jgi:WD40 repeat protein
VAATRSNRALLVDLAAGLVARDVAGLAAPIAPLPGEGRVLFSGHSGWARPVDDRTLDAAGEWRAHEAGKTCVATAATPGILATGTDDELRVWSAPGRPLGPPLRLPGRGELVALAVSPDGSRLAASFAKVPWREGSVVLLRLPGLDAPVELETGGGVAPAVAFVPGVPRVVTGGADGRVQLWDVGTGQSVLVLGTHTGIVYCAAVSPDGKRIASGSGTSEEPGEIRLWEVP